MTPLLIAPLFLGSASRPAVLPFGTAQLQLPAAPTTDELVAAADLNHYVQRLSGEALPVVTPGNASSSLANIFVGSHPEVSRRAKVNVAALGDEGYSASCFPEGSKHAALLTGGPLGGASSAVRAVLHELGVHWLHPGPIGEVMPVGHVAGLPVELNLTSTPALMERNFRSLYNNDGIMSECASYPHAVLWVSSSIVKELASQELAWLGRMGMSRGGIGVGGPGEHGKPLTPPWGQAFGTWWVQYGRSHPEWFALQSDGKRAPPNPAQPAGVKMCVSQPSLWAKVASGYVTGQHGVSACEDDGNQGFCNCPKCKALDAPLNHSDPYDGSMSDRYSFFWDMVAHQLEHARGDEDLWVTGYAYDNYTAPPQRYKMTHNVMVGLVVSGGEFGYPARTAELARDRGWWRGWAAAGAMLNHA